MDIFETFSRAFQLMGNSFSQTHLSEGINDVIVVKWKSGEFKSTEFNVNFGSISEPFQQHQIRILVNNILVSQGEFSLDRYGYVTPKQPSADLLRKMNLKLGKNQIQFILNKKHIMKCELHLYDQDDKILISDVDGTMTKSDISGLAHNYMNKSYLHEGYAQLIQKAQRNGYKIVWVTMRAFSLYKFSKQYIFNHAQTNGALFMVPQQFTNAVKKQVSKNTVEQKIYLMSQIRNAFPSHINPFVGGLGNRENDAIAYEKVKILRQNIFIINTDSHVRVLGSNKITTYKHMHQNFHSYLLKQHDKKKEKFQSLQNFRNRQKLDNKGVLRKSSSISTAVSSQQN